MLPQATRNIVAAAYPAGKWSSVARSGASWFIVGLVACLSTPVVHNMASKKQSMNRTFEPLRIVNTYGAFGSVSKVRFLVIFYHYTYFSSWRKRSCGRVCLVLVD